MNELPNHSSLYPFLLSSVLSRDALCYEYGIEMTRWGGACNGGEALLYRTILSVLSCGEDEKGRHNVGWIVWKRCSKMG